MFQHTSIASRRRRGAVLVFALVMFVVLLGFGSLTLDVGAMYNARADLQNAADAAALAGASMLTDDMMISIRLGEQTSTEELKQLIYERAVAVAAQVTSFGGKSIQLEVDDVQIGWIDQQLSSSQIDLTQPPSKINAVHVIARRTKTSVNGPVQLFFASIFGKPTADVTASATAAFDDKLAGLQLETGPTLLPFSIQDTTWDMLLAQNIDDFHYDESTDGVSAGGDGIPEMDIFPHKLLPGNFGRLSIGLADVDDQVLNGVSAEDLMLEVGTPILKFVDDDGNPISYKMGGDTGMKATLQEELGQRLGDIVSIPIHSMCSGNGNNATFTIVAVRFVRIMKADLSGGDKGVWLQPVTYIGPAIITDPNAPSSDGAAGQIVLVR